MVKCEYTEYIERLLFEINQKRHGGTIILVPDSLDINDSRLTDRVAIKYPYHYLKPWDILIRDIVLNKKYWDEHDKLWDSKSRIPVNDFRKSCQMRSLLRIVSDQKSDMIKFIASTSGVDGAVLMTDKLRLLGFGAEVIALSPTLSEIMVAKDASGSLGSYTSIENFGTRHRSAFRFCSSYEDSVAFIISQDGGVKAVKRVADKVVLWPGIDIGAF